MSALARRALSGFRRDGLGPRGSARNIGPRSRWSQGGSDTLRAPRRKAHQRRDLALGHANPRRQALPTPLLQNDLSGLVNLYYSKGYRDAEIVRKLLRLDAKNRVHIHIEINSGALWTVRALTLVGGRAFCSRHPARSGRPARWRASRLRQGARRRAPTTGLSQSARLPSCRRAQRVGGGRPRQPQHRGRLSHQSPGARCTSVPSRSKASTSYTRARR